MLNRRRLLGALGSAGLPAGWAACLFPATAAAAGVSDVLSRPAAVVRLASKPSMLRIARAGGRLVAVGERGVVLWSDDDGRQWQQAQVPVSVTLTGVQFIDERLGWAIGHGGVVLNSVDGGQRWALQFDGRRINAALQTRADELAAANLRDDAAVLRAAKLAALAQQDGPDKPLLALHFSDASHGWVVGAFGLALLTRDGGRSWQSRTDLPPNPKGLHFYSLNRLGDQLLIAGEQGLLVNLPADDTAYPATLLPTPYRGSFFASAALPDDHLLLGGLRGTVLLRNRAGEFKALDSGTERAIVSMATLPNGDVALVDQAGGVLLGNVATGRFSALPGDPERRWVAVVAARDGTLVGAGTAGVARLSRFDASSK